jgi:hypothetical protein
VSRYLALGLVACSSTPPSPSATATAPEPAAPAAPATPAAKQAPYNHEHPCALIRESEARSILGAGVGLRDQAERTSFPACVIAPPKGTPGIIAKVSHMPFPPADNNKPLELPPGQPIPGLDHAVQEGNNELLSMTWADRDWMVTVILSRTDGLGDDGAGVSPDRMPSKESLTPYGKRLLDAVIARLPPAAEALKTIR